jgi:hypothetical protein
MIEILNTLVSLDLFKVLFCCDLEKCHGMCCVEGDAGAPVSIEEVGLLEEAYEVIHDDLSSEAQAQIDAEGVVYPDKDGLKAWSERTLQLIHETGYKKLKVNPTIISSNWRKEDGPKADIADITVRQLCNVEKRKGMQLLADIIREHPVVGSLVEKFDLEIVTTK